MSVEFLVTLVVFAIFAIVGLRSAHAQIRRLREKLQLVSAQFENVEITHSFLNPPVVRGVARGRAFTCSYSSGNKNTAAFVEIELEVPQSFNMLIEPMTWARRLMIDSGFTSDHCVGDSDFDSRFHLDVDATTRRLVDDFVGQGQIRDVIEELFAGDNISQLKFASGTLTAKWSARDLDMVAQYDTPLLQLCELTEGVIRIKLLQSEARQELGDVRCPYCREWIFAESHATGLVACSQCGTPHHGDCWGEHDGCSVFGCGAPEGRALTSIPTGSGCV